MRSASGQRRAQAAAHSPGRGAPRQRGAHATGSRDKVDAAVEQGRTKAAPRTHTAVHVGPSTREQRCAPHRGATEARSSCCERIGTSGCRAAAKVADRAPKLDDDGGLGVACVRAPPSHKGHAPPPPDRRPTKGPLPTNRPHPRPPPQTGHANAPPQSTHATPHSARRATPSAPPPPSTSGRAAHPLGEGGAWEAGLSVGVVLVCQRSPLIGRPTSGNACPHIHSSCIDNRPHRCIESPTPSSKHDFPGQVWPHSHT